MSKAPAWLKQKRQAQQQRDIDAKTQREIDFFWETQASNLARDRERGGPPRKGRARLEEEEHELFEEKAGMAKGIDFDKYNDIQVEINGDGHESLEICETFEQIAKSFHLTRWLRDNIWKCHYEVPTPVQKYATST